MQPLDPGRAGPPPFSPDPEGCGPAVPSGHGARRGGRDATAGAGRFTRRPQKATMPALLMGAREKFFLFIRARISWRRKAGAGAVAITLHHPPEASEGIAAIPGNKPGQRALPRCGSCNTGPAAGRACRSDRPAGPARRPAHRQTRTAGVASKDDAFPRKQREENIAAVRKLQYQTCEGPTWPDGATKERRPAARPRQ